MSENPLVEKLRMHIAANKLMQQNADKLTTESFYDGRKAAFELMAKELYFDGAFPPGVSYQDAMEHMGL